MSNNNYTISITAGAPCPPLSSTQGMSVPPVTHRSEDVLALIQLAREFGQLAQALSSDRKLSADLAAAGKIAANNALAGYNAYRKDSEG